MAYALKIFQKEISIKSIAYLYLHCNNAQLP